VARFRSSHGNRVPSIFETLPLRSLAICFRSRCNRIGFLVLRCQFERARQGCYPHSPRCGSTEYPGAFGNGRPRRIDIIHQKNFAASDFLGSQPGEGTAYIFALKRPVATTAGRASVSFIVIGQRIGRQDGFSANRTDLAVGGLDGLKTSWTQGRLGVRHGQRADSAFGGKREGEEILGSTADPNCSKTTPGLPPDYRRPSDCCLGPTVADSVLTTAEDCLLMAARGHKSRSRAVLPDTSSIAVTRTSKQRSVRAWPAVSPGLYGAGPTRARERA
jgi:hypothetical protein